MFLVIERINECSRAHWFHFYSLPRQHDAKQHLNTKYISMECTRPKTVFNTVERFIVFECMSISFKMTKNTKESKKNIFWTNWKLNKQLINMTYKWQVAVKWHRATFLYNLINFSTYIFLICLLLCTSTAYDLYYYFNRQRRIQCSQKKTKVPSFKWFEIKSICFF